MAATDVPAPARMAAGPGLITGSSAAEPACAGRAGGAEAGGWGSASLGATHASAAVPLGFWSAALVAAASLAFSAASVPVLLGGVRPPWADVLTLGPSLVLAPAFLALLVCVHEIAPEDRKIWGHLAVAFGCVYVALVCVVYTVALTVVEPLIVRGEAARAGLLTIDPGGVLNAIDGLGYTFLCLATLFAAPVFQGDRLSRWIKWLLIANAASAVPILLTYFVDRSWLVVVGPWWTVTVPGSAFLLALFFRRAGRAAAQTASG